MTHQITLPVGDRNAVFVFGSNLSGLHGGGAARFAMDNYGAILGQPSGLQGRSYAIPTLQFPRDRGMPVEKLSLIHINYYVARFLYEAEHEMSHKTFYVTPIGCGIAGFKPEEIKPMFHCAPANVILPEEFK